VLPPRIKSNNKTHKIQFTCLSFLFIDVEVVFLIDEGRILCYNFTAHLPLRLEFVFSNWHLNQYEHWLCDTDSWVPNWLFERAKF
jgi:hypothetical protein